MVRRRTLAIIVIFLFVTAIVYHSVKIYSLEHNNVETNGEFVEYPKMVVSNFINIDITFNNLSNADYYLGFFTKNETLKNDFVDYGIFVSKIWKEMRINNSYSINIDVSSFIVIYLYRGYEGIIDDVSVVLTVFVRASSLLMLNNL